MNDNSSSIEKPSKKDHLIECAVCKIEEANTIINNASTQCSNLKILFLSCCLPASATCFSIYFGNNQPLSFAFIASCFYFIILAVGVLLNFSFYSRQFEYRKVKGSLELLKENITLNDIECDLSIEDFNKYYHAIHKVSVKTNKTFKLFIKSLRDALPFIIPLSILAIFWLAVGFCRLGGYCL